MAEQALVYAPMGAQTARRSQFFTGHPEIFAMLDDMGRFTDCNDSFCNLVGMGRAQITGQHFDVLLAPFGLVAWVGAVADVEDRGRHRSKDWYQRRADGVVQQIQFDITALPAANGFALTGIDLSAEASQQDKLERLAVQDTLTGVNNRRFIETRLAELVARCAPKNDRFALLLLDLDAFKAVNDGYGHAMGDLVLRQVAETLSDVVPLGETVGRIGGDEFVVIIEDYLGQNALLALAEEIRQAVARPIYADPAPVRPGISIGMSVFPDDGHDFTTLMAHADHNMFRDKEARKTRPPHTGFHEEARAFARPRDDRAIIQDLVVAIQSAQLVPCFQPIADLKTGRITAAEALCRWLHPQRGPLDPPDFIPVAEHHGLIDQIDRLIIAEVLQMIKTHGDGALSDVRIFANVSAATVSGPDFALYVLEQLRLNNVPPDRLGLELTESMALMESDCGRECLTQLSACGVAIALDDFGTGFSSLAMLKDLPVSYLKLDRSFVRNIDQDPRDSALISAIISLCEALGAQIIVEGIETDAQRQKLLPLGMVLGQGFLLGRPMHKDDFVDRLERTRR